jgi:hypothetical protein
MTTKIQYFQLPIKYLDKKYPINKNILEDLELIKSVDASSNSLYSHVFKPNICFGKDTLPLWGEYFTNDTVYLTDTQNLLKSYDSSSIKNFPNFNGVKQIWDEIKSETGFREKYQYIDWPWFKHFNNNAQFLQILSIYNLTSPVLSLALPIIFLLLPFVILKIQGINLTFEKYYNAFKELVSKHPIGQLLTQFKSVGWDKRVYMIISVLFYLFQIYQNVLACLRFYKNMKKIHTYLFTMRDYIDFTLNKMDHFLTFSSKLKTYEPFNSTVKKQQVHLQHFKKNLDSISNYKFLPKKLIEIGHVMKCFYNLYCNEDYNECLLYSFGFNGYLNNIEGLQSHIQNKNVNICKFSEKTVFKHAFYPALMNEKPVKNSYNLNKHILITGPNAAGKTTLLKTTLFNILLSQQLGCGFYKSASVCPYQYLHCYLNIPDTSARDSLFQAEARRCKEILTTIQKSPDNEKHFCIFDELYSGTNPYEAIGSAFSFLSFLTKYKNVDFILTTHYLELCQRLDINKNIKNYHMKIKNKTPDSFTYTYKLKSGISTIKGGVKVLNDLDYPQEIIDATIKTINEREN